MAFGFCDIKGVWQKACQKINLKMGRFENLKIGIRKSTIGNRRLT
jgi:hypothetical protein